MTGYVYHTPGVLSEEVITDAGMGAALLEGYGRLWIDAYASDGNEARVRSVLIHRPDGMDRDGLERYIKEKGKGLMEG